MASPPPPSVIPSVVDYDTTQSQVRSQTQSTHADPSFIRSSEPYGWPSSASRRSHVSKVSWNWMPPPDGRSSVGPSNHNNHNYNQTPGNGRRPLPQPAYSGGYGYNNKINAGHQSAGLGTGEGLPFAPQYRQPPAPSEVGLGSSQSDDNNGPDQEDDYGDEGDMEDMSVGPIEGDIEQGGGPQGGGRRRGRARNFVGGFVSGLRRIPGMMTRTSAPGGGVGGWGIGTPPQTQEKKLDKRKDTYGLPEDQATTSTLPRYEDPGQPLPGPSAVTYVQAMSMPTEEGPSAQPSYVDGGDYSLSYTTDPPLQNPHESRAHRSHSHVSHQSQSHRSRSYSHHSRSYSRSHVPTAHTIDSRSQTSSQSFSRSPRSGSQPSGQGVVQSPYMETPIQVTPLPTSDYKGMDVPPRLEPPDDSFSAHINRLQNFFRQVRDLPWTSSRITVDYFPMESSRARLAEKVRVDGSWYSQREMASIDLLEPATVTPFTGGAESQPRAPPPAMTTRHTDGGRREPPAGYATHRIPPVFPPPTRRAAQRATTTRIGSPAGHTPMSQTTGLIPSPGLSSHGLGPASGSPQSVQYTAGYYLPNPPQPLYLMQSGYPSPRSPTGVPGPGGVGGEALPPITMPMPMVDGVPPPNALPLYVVTAPSPVMVSRSPGPAHMATLHGSGKAEQAESGAGVGTNTIATVGAPSPNASATGKVEG